MKENNLKKDKKIMWGNIRDQFESGVSVGEIKQVRSNIVNKSSVYRRAEKEGWESGRKKFDRISMIHAKRLQQTEEKGALVDRSCDDAINQAIDESKHDMLHALSSEIEKDYADIIKSSRYLLSRAMGKLKELDDDELTFQDLSAAQGIIKSAKTMLVGDEFSRGVILRSMVQNALNLTPEERRARVHEAAYYKALDGDSTAMKAYLESSKADSLTDGVINITLTDAKPVE